jgi:hypothetical protein
MKHTRITEQKLILVTLALACMALVAVWPQWRDELRAQDYEGQGYHWQDHEGRDYSWDCGEQYECDQTGNLWKVTWCCAVYHDTGQKQCEFNPEPLPPLGPGPCVP